MTVQQHRSPQGSPRALAKAGRRGGQRSILWGGVRCCGDGVGAAGPGHAKTSTLGRKTVLGPFRGSAASGGVVGKGCANVTRLAAAEPFGRLPGGQPRRRGLPAAASAAVQALGGWWRRSPLWARPEVWRSGRRSGWRPRGRCTVAARRHHVARAFTLGQWHGHRHYRNGHIHEHV